MTTINRVDRLGNDRCRENRGDATEGRTVFVASTNHRAGIAPGYEEVHFQPLLMAEIAKLLPHIPIALALEDLGRDEDLEQCS